MDSVAAVYADYATPKTIKNKYTDIDMLEKGYYVVENITIITSNGDESRFRVDLNCEKFVIIDLNIHKHIKEYHLISLKKSKDLIIMRHTECGLYLYAVEKQGKYFLYDAETYTECYHSTKQIDWKDLHMQRRLYYNVLFFSIVEIHGENRIRVDINDDHGQKYFILPELDHVPHVSIQDLNFWNNRRWLLSINSAWYTGLKIYFHKD